MARTVIVDVADFGAVGDGAADDAGPIQAAVDAAAVSGSEVRLRGAFAVSRPIIFDNTARSITIRGSSDRFPYEGPPTGTRLVPMAGFPTGRGLIEFRSAGTGNDRPGAILLDGITLDGTAYLSYGIRITSGRNLQFSRMHITASQPVSISPIGTFVDFVRFQDSFLQETGGAAEAIRIDYAATTDLAVTDVIFDNTWILGGKVDGSAVYADSVEGLEFRSCYFDPGNVAITVAHLTSSTAYRTSRNILFQRSNGENVGTFLQIDGAAPVRAVVSALRTLPSTATGHPAYLFSGSTAHQVEVIGAAHLNVDPGGDSLATGLTPEMRFISTSTRGRVLPAVLSGAPVDIDTNRGDQFDVYVSDSYPLTISVPRLNVPGMEITIRIVNVAGLSLSAATWTGYKMAAWTQPAPGFSRSIRFRYDGAAWVEISRTSSDIPN
jgi:hypothetical protein